MSDPYALAAHRSFDEVEPQLHAALGESLNPRGPDALYDLVAECALPAGAKVVDVGCGRGRQSLELARRFGLDVLGVDPVNRHGEVEQVLASSVLDAGSVRFDAGIAERLPVGDASVDFIFCRDSIMFAKLDEAAAEEVDGTPAQRLLWASRLLRQRERYVSEFGIDRYDIMLGDCLWHAYRLIGKLTGYACTFSRT